MVYNYNNLPKLPFTGYNLPTQVLPAPILHCAQASAPAYAPCATNLCHNHFNSYHNYYDTCYNPCDTFDFFC